MPRNKGETHQWYSMKALAENEAEIFIYEQIGEQWWGGGIAAKKFIDDLKALGDLSKITLRINSPGGVVFEGHTIYNALKRHKAQKVVHIDGLAASIASVIAMAGDRIIMPENSMMMIHDPWTIAMGGREEMLAVADRLEKVKTGIVAVYKRKSGMDEDKIRDLMAEETWMTAQEAIELGFADELESPVEDAAFSGAFDLSIFRNAPTDLIVPPSKPPAVAEATETPVVNDETGDEKTMDVAKLKAEFPEVAKALIDEGKKEGAKAELQRIKDVQDQTLPGHEELIANLMFDGVTTGGQAASKILAAEKNIRAAALKNHVEDANKPVAPNADATTSVASPGDDEDLSVADKAKAEWEKDKKLQKEMDVEAYVKLKEIEASKRI